MKTIVKILVAAVIAACMGICAVKAGLGNDAVTAIVVFGGLMVSLAIGVFDDNTRKADVKNGVKNYRKAA